MVTKRQLGMIIIAFASLALLGIIVVDMVGAGKWGGFGPLQSMGIGLGATAIGVGCVLIRLGDRPA